MLTLEEAGLALSFFKVFSILNILPIQVDVQSGKIQRQSSKIKILIWKFLFGVGVSHWLYMFGRLVQSIILEPEKYFRWDHFVLHFGLTGGYAAFYFTGFCLFVKTPDENVLVFNQLFAQGEDPVQKMIDQLKQLKRQMNPKSGNETQDVFSASGNKTRVNSETRLVSPSARGSNEGQCQHEVMQNRLGSGSGSEVYIRPRPRPLLTWPPQYSLDELVTKLLPFAIMSMGCFVILILAVDPSRPHLFYSSLPPEWQNPWSFIVLLAVEAVGMLVTFLTSNLSIITQVLFFGKCQLEFQRISLQLRNLKEKFQNRSLENTIRDPNEGRDVEREMWILRQILKEMRELVVVIELFNRCFPLVIFPIKICGLSLCITGYFFAIRYHLEFPFLAAFLGYIAVLVTVIYTVMYENAFSIPEKREDLKTEFLLTAQKTTTTTEAPAATSTSTSTLNSNPNVNVNKILRAEMKREIQRVFSVGIKVGSFHQMERDSTPSFIDFVFGQVVDLLVTFRG